ncbi:hypothetical protein WA158_003593 [Blastocystis sp. Blastoise]
MYVLLVQVQDFSYDFLFRLILSFLTIFSKLAHAEDTRYTYLTIYYPYSSESRETLLFILALHNSISHANTSIPFIVIIPEHIPKEDIDIFKENNVSLFPMNITNIYLQEQYPIDYQRLLNTLYLWSLDIKGLWSPELYEYINSSPFINFNNISSSSSESPLYRFSIQYQFNTLMYYEKYSWLLYNCSSSSLPIPVNILSYSSPLFHTPYFYPISYTSPNSIFTLNTYFNQYIRSIHYSYIPHILYSIRLYIITILLLLFFFSFLSSSFPILRPIYFKGYLLSLLATYTSFLSRYLVSLLSLIILSFILHLYIPLFLPKYDAYILFITYLSISTLLPTLYIIYQYTNNSTIYLYILPIIFYYIYFILHLFVSPSFSDTFSFLIQFILYISLLLWSLNKPINIILDSREIYYTKLPLGNRG